MKKRIIAFFLTMTMIITLLPVSLVKADMAEDVTNAKLHIDAILEKAPTPEDYTAEIADSVDGLGSLLSGMEEPGISELDVYVTEATLIEDGSGAGDSSASGGAVSGSGTAWETSRYTSVQAFYEDYQKAQDQYMGSEAKVIIDRINDLLTRPLDRENFESIKTVYNEASDYVKSYVKGDDAGNAFNQLRELMDRADRAVTVIDEITELNRESDYERFAASVEAAESAVDLYYSKYSDLRRYGKYVDCLPRDNRDKLISNYAVYEKAGLLLDVEKAYYAIADFEVMDDEVKEEMAALQEAVKAADESEYNVSVYDFYNGEEIQQLLSQYEKVIALEEKLDVLPEKLTSTIELAAALRAYDYYNKSLTEEEKAFIPESYKKRLMDAVMISTECDKVVDAIAQIGTVTNGEDFTDFSNRYEAAYITYRSFINQYRDVSGIADLITNAEQLNDATAVLEMIRNIQRLAGEKDAAMCAQLIQMESIRTEYQSMEPELQAQIFNIEVFEQIYKDTQSAFAVKSKIEGIRNNFTLEDEVYIQSVRTEYDGLNDKAKAYVGESKYTSLLMVEKQLAAMNQNAADQVSGKIAAIGTVSIKSRDAIKAARSSYDALSAKQKALVTNYTTLTAAEKTYSTLGTSIAKAEVSGLGSYTYSGSELIPLLTVKLNNAVLLQGLDYTVTYASNVNAGTAKVTLKGTGYYTGTLTKTFTIRTESLSAASVTDYKKQYVYTGKKIKPSPKVKMGSTVLKKNRDYTISYYYNKKCGTAFMVINGKGNYSGSTMAKFDITKKSLKKAKVTGLKKTYRRTGKKISPSFKLKVNGVTLKKNRDYTVSYKNNVAKGKATITVKGKGNYSGTKKLKFKIS